MKSTRPSVLRGFPDSLMEVDRSIYIEADEYGSFCEAVVGCVGVGVLVVSPDGTHLLKNAEMNRMMAVGFPEGHSGSPGQVGEVYSLGSKTRLESDELPSSRSQQGENYTDLRVELGTEEGLRLTVSLTARTLHSQTGAMLGTVVVATDVTDLSHALEAKDHFVANVSHELRTPLTSIIGYLEIMLDEPHGVSAEMRAHLSIARRNAERLLGVVDGLLHPATVHSAMHLILAATDLRKLVDHAVESAAPRAKAAGVRLSASAEPSRSIAADGARLLEVFDNVISNALKFTPRGGEVHVSLEPHGDRVHVVVCDSGPGIAPDDREHIFERFFRSASAESNAVQGVGLGLSIAREIVAAHHGQIRVEESPTGGGKFIVDLPS